MSFDTDIIDKIVSYKSVSKRDKIDRLLKIDAIQYQNLGIDSSKHQKNTVKKNSRYIYKAIQKINHEMGTKFLYYQDK